MRPKFITDANLGKLVKWLRLLGYDTVYHRGNVDSSFIKRACQEGRIGLTRCSKSRGRPYPVKLIFLKSEKVGDQIEELKENVSLEVERVNLFCRCAVCNGELREVEKDEISGSVPHHVLLSHHHFKACLRCGRIYWPGTHQKKIINRLAGHSLWDRP